MIVGYLPEYTMQNEISSFGEYCPYGLWAGEICKWQTHRRVVRETLYLYTCKASSSGGVGVGTKMMAENYLLLND